MYNGLKPNEWNYHLKLIENNIYYSNSFDLNDNTSMKKVTSD